MEPTWGTLITAVAGAATTGGFAMRLWDRHRDLSLRKPLLDQCLVTEDDDGWLRLSLEIVNHDQHTWSLQEITVSYPFGARIVGQAEIIMPDGAGGSETETGLLPRAFAAAAKSWRIDFALRPAQTGKNRQRGVFYVLPPASHWSWGWLPWVGGRLRINISTRCTATKQSHTLRHTEKIIASTSPSTAPTATNK